MTSQMSDYSKAINEAFESSRKRDEQAAKAFEESLPALKAAMVDLDHDDLVDTYMDMCRGISNHLLLVHRVNYAEALRKEIIRRMESC